MKLNSYYEKFMYRMVGRCQSCHLVSVPRMLEEEQLDLLCNLEPVATR
jgi:hypothetical protein